MKTKWQAVLLAVFFIGLILVLLGYSWYQNKMARVEAGSARPTFPYADYSLEELEKLYPQYIENTAPTVQTPEQTHAKFLAALKKEDFDEAVGCCVVEKYREKMRNNLQEIKKDGDMPQMIRDLDQKIDKESMDSWKANYSFAIIEDGKKFGHIITFFKNTDGVWLIESL